MTDSADFDDFGGVDFDVDQANFNPGVGGGEDMSQNPVGLPGQPIGLTNVGLSGNPLPENAPLPPSEYNTCAATEGLPINPQQYYQVADFLNSAVKEEVKELEPPLEDGDRNIDRKGRRKLDSLRKDVISNLTPVKFTGIGFSLIDDEITRFAIPITKDKNPPNHYNTVRDPRLGTTSGTKACRTCGNTVEGCSGHYGYIKLNRFYSPNKYKSSIVSVLSCVCISCRRLLVTMEELRQEKIWRYADNDSSKEIIWMYPKWTRLKMIQLYIKENKETHQCRRVVVDRDRARGVVSSNTTCIRNPKYKVVNDRINYILDFPSTGGKKKSSSKALELEQVRWFLEQIPTWEYEIVEDINGRNIRYKISESEYQELNDIQNKEILETAPFPPNSYTIQERTPTGIHTAVLTQEEILLLQRRFNPETARIGTNGEVVVQESIAQRTGFFQPVDVSISVAQYDAFQRLKQRQFQGTPLLWSDGVYLLKVSIPAESSAESSSGSTNNDRIVQAIAISPEEYQTFIELKARRILSSKRIAADSQILGFNPPSHPAKMIRRYTVVPPLCVRPTSTRDGVETEDDLTILLRGIVTRNNNVQPITLDVDAMYRNGQQVEYFPPIRKQVIENRTPATQAAKGRRRTGVARNKVDPVKALRERIHDLYFGAQANTNRKEYTSVRKKLQGKTGVIRKDMTGKRGDYSARTVLSPSGEHEYGDIGLPRIWASILTYPEEVTDHNKALLMALMKAGRVTKIRKRRDRNHFITIRPGQNMDETLESGDIIERYLMDGDMAGVNRNPTLHAYGLMGYKIYFHDGLTIRLHINHTIFHNADFDGDEANIFIPRSIESVAELRSIMNARYCIQSAQENKPLTGLIFNDLTDVYNLTSMTDLVNEATWWDCMEIMNRPQRPSPAVQLTTLAKRLEKHQMHPRSGRALFSCLLPPDFSYNEKGITIIDGILTSSKPLDKGTAGPTHRSILQQIYISYGAEQAALFLSDSSAVLKRWSKDFPVTTGMCDCFPKEDLDTEVLPLYSIFHNETLDLYDTPEDRAEFKAICIDTIANHSERSHADTVDARAAALGIELDIGQFVISDILPIDFELVVEGREIARNGIFLIQVNDRERARIYNNAIFQKLATDYGNRRAFDYNRDLVMILERCFEVSSKGGPHHEMLRQQLERAKTIIEEYGKDLMDPNKREKALKFINAQLGNMAEEVGQRTLEENLDPENNFKRIVAGAKTKGKPTNIANIQGLLGLQFSGTELVAKPGDSIYQALEDLDPEAFGFIGGNFLNGMTLYEFFVHAKAARGGLVDTSIKTAEPGDLARQLIKTFEDTKVYTDQTVRMGNGDIIQTLYGGTRFNPERLINVKFPDGVIPFFIDIGTIVGRLNSEYYIQSDLLIQLDNEEPFDVDLGTYYEKVSVKKEEEEHAEIPLTVIPLAHEM